MGGVLASEVRVQEAFGSQFPAPMSPDGGWGAPPLPDNRETLAEQLVRYHYGEGSHFSCSAYRASTGESPDRDDRRRGRPRDSMSILAVPFAKCRYAIATSTPVARASDAAAASLR